MKNALRISLPVLVSVVLFGASAPFAFAATATSVNLGTAGNFAILAKGSAPAGITDVPTSVITGNVGASPITGAAIGITCAEVTGTIYSVDAAGPPPCSVENATLLSTAVGDMGTAYTAAAGGANVPGTAAFLNVGAGTLGTSGTSQHFVPGVYTWTGGVTIPNDIYLDGSATDVWVFQISGTLVVSSGVTVHLTSGALAKNVFWAVTGATTLGTTSVFEGNILTTGTSYIALQTGAVLNGRALSDGSVTLDHATVTIPPAISAPIVTSVASSTGATAGGTIVTITGSGFTGATAVKFGTTAATSFTVNSDTSITATSPAGIGAVDVTVTAPGGTSATGSADQFTYAPCVGAIGSPLLVNVTQNISNDVDSGFHGNWALDDYTRHIQVWLDSGTTYCAQVDYNGTFHAPAGVSSPAAGTPIPAAIVGTMVGGYRASIVGTLLASQTIPTTVDYQGVISTGATPGYVSWPGATFNTGYTFNYLDNGNDWSWTYTTPNGATWINAGSGSTGDIGPVVDTNTGTGYETIQAAVTAAHSGDTINVAAGTYDSFSVANKTGITITGAGTTATLIVPTTLVTTGVAHKYTSNLLASVFVNNSTNVLIQGMTIQSNNQTPGSGGPDAIVFWNASTGSIKDCAVTGTYAINGVQTGQGIAVDAASGTTSLTVNNCAISGFQKNGIEAIDGNGAVSGATDTTTVTVTGGSITGAGPTGAIAQNGIVLWNRGGGTVTGSVNGTTISGFDYTGADTAAGALAYGGGNLTTVHNATLTNNQLNLSTTGSPAIDATQNYWGRAAGPDVTTLDGSITYSPWWADAAMTTLQSSTTPDTNGNQTTSLPSVSTLIGTSTASTNINVTAVIPSGTTVTGNTTWDGVISAPTPPVTTPTVIVSGFNTTVTSAVTVGSTASDLIFDNAVKLTFAGQSGQHVGWYNHAGAFTEITATCAANDQITGDALAAGTSCKIDASPDLVVWTKHFSTFVTYTQTAIPPTPVATTPVVNGSILSFSGGGGGTPNPLPGAIAVNTETVTTTNTTTSVPQGRVLGAAVYNFGQNLTIGSQGADVTALQQYLINGGYSIPAGVTGYFGAETRAAVIAFQKATGIAQVGIVGPLTRADLDKGVIATTPETTPTVEKTNLTTSQVDSILGVLQSFNVDQATMNKVRAALGL